MWVILNKFIIFFWGRFLVSQKKSTILQWHMGRFIYCLILHEDQNISSWELDMNIWLFRLDVRVWKFAATEALECLQCTACSVTVSWTREAGGGAGWPPVHSCSHLASQHPTAGPCSVLTCHPRPLNHTTVSVRSLSHINAEWVAFCIYLVGLRNICCCLTTSHTKSRFILE